jgi:hypothetical protein
MRQQLDTLMQENPTGDLQDGNNNHEAEKPNSVIGGLTNNLHPNNPEPLTSFNVGMKIAFKQIEMSKEYTPEISNFKVLYLMKEAEVLSYDPFSGMIHLKTLTSGDKNEAGKFELPPESVLSYEQHEQSIIHCHVKELIEPRPSS